MKSYAHFDTFSIQNWDDGTSYASFQYVQLIFCDLMPNMQTLVHWFITSKEHLQDDMVI